MSDNKNIAVIEAGNDNPQGGFSRIENSKEIKPGHHWRCLHDVEGVVPRRESPFEFTAGLVYLLTRVVYFDGRLHSVEFLNDPSVDAGAGVLTLPLLFEHFEMLTEQEAKAFRQTQMLAVQNEAAEVQREMAAAIEDPRLLEGEVRAGLEAWERELAAQNRRDEDDEEEAPKKLEYLPAVSAGGQFNLAGAIDNRISSTDVSVFQHMARRQGKVAEIRGKWLTNKVELLGRVLKKLTPFYSEHAAIGQAQAQDALGLAADVEKGLRSLRLYTGEGVTVTTIASGESAPPSEPLTVYQSKLFMDEEFAVWDTVDRMFDHTNVGVFFTALAENEQLRTQLIPAARGVVAMAVRRTDVDYEAKTLAQMLDAQARNYENKALFLLVRDGENWYQVHSDEPSHELSPRLFPTRNEVEDIFAGLDGTTIDFNDLRFTNRTSEFDRKALAYKRFLILACGLDHNRKLFGQFYPERDAMSFISLDFQSKYMRFVSDGDSDFMLGDNVPSVSDYIAQNQSQLAAGCRVLVFGRAALRQRDAAPGAYSKGSYTSRGTTYRRLVSPVCKALFLTVRRDKEDLVVHLPVERDNDHSYSGWGSPKEIVQKRFSVKVALNKLCGGDLAYILTDTLKAEELRPFVYSRAQRANHWDYIYGFKLAMELLVQEEVVNAPVMHHLQREASVKFGLTPATAAIAAVAAVQGWRQKNPEADVLPAINGPDFPPLDFQLAEASYAYTHSIPLLEKHINGIGGRLVRVMRAKKGQLVAYYEQPDSEKDHRIQPWQWLGRRTYTAAGKPTKDEPQSVWMTKGRISGEFELFGVESTYSHNHAASESERSLLERRIFQANLVDAMAQVLPGAFKGERQGVSDEAWAYLTAMRPKKSSSIFERTGEPEKQKIIRDRRVALPVGVDTSTGALVTVCLPVYDVLYFYASDAQRAALLQQGYTLPKPKKRNGVIVPSEGPELSVYVDPYAYPQQYTGPVGTDVSFSPFREYRTGPYDYKGPNRLDMALNFILAHVPADAAKDKQHEWDRVKYLDGSGMWLPPSFRAHDGSASVSRFFPGLLTA